jgi:hypothetical protein
MLRRLLLSIVLAPLITAVPAPVAAGQNETPETAAATPSADTPAPCATTDHRRFDFWVGEWEVRGKKRPPEAPPAHNRITLVADGCALREEYTTPGPYNGTSLSFWDARAKLWRQTWIDNQGQPLRLAGGWRDGSMMMAGPDPAAPSERITWTPGEDGSVRQLWERTEDGGDTWTTVFDGLYTPAGDGPR